MFTAMWTQMSAPLPSCRHFQRRLLGNAPQERLSLERLLRPELFDFRYKASCGTSLYLRSNQDTTFHVACSHQLSRLLRYLLSHFHDALDLECWHHHISRSRHVILVQTLDIQTQSIHCTRLVATMMTHSEHFSSACHAILHALLW